MIRVAFVGAPDSGKTTLAKVVSARLNLKGYVPALIHEYARDYITKYHLRPNTVAEQFFVFYTQYEREEEMCSQSTQIMYTDCPIILSYVYAIDLVKDEKDRDMLAYLYNKTLTVIEDRYDLIFLLRPFRETVKDDVRAQDWDRIGKLDTQIKGFLDLHGIPYTELGSDVNMDTRTSIVELAVEKVYTDTEERMKEMYNYIDKLRV